MFIFILYLSKNEEDSSFFNHKQFISKSFFFASIAKFTLSEKPKNIINFQIDKQRYLYYIYLSLKITLTVPLRVKLRQREDNIIKLDSSICDMREMSGLCQIRSSNLYLRGAGGNLL